MYYNVICLMKNDFLLLFIVPYRNSYNKPRGQMTF